MDYQHVLVYFMWTFTAVSAQDVKYFLKGHDIHLMPSISERPIESIWLHNENDVVFFTGTEDFVNSSYKNRITLDRVSAELTIKNATYEDSGVYHLGMDINNELHTFQCTIEVIDKVSKPNISCEMSDTKQATLVCSTESKHPHLLKFKWSSPGKEQTGPNLKITVRNEDDDQVYRCDVSNPLTNETASFTAKDCFLGKRSDGQLIFICIFTLVIVVCCVLYITHQYLKACFDTYIMNRRPSAVKVSRERDENTCFLDKVFTLPFNQNKINKKGNSDTSNDQQVHLRNSEENVKTDDFLSGATLSDWGGIRRRSKSWTGTISTNDRTVHLKKEDNFRERIMTSSLK
ncbi:CD48 antigen-like isoform X2 [Entelurus aequoreus]|uniref:CD48 antigen-like isoform X2 n=1 Tax=Entelurus aequoreus TaxID=161455 RepID=UPI002B1D3304|nr:CD48 antigen-like isoform X2 [Entelurus aequoreus]